MPPVKGSLDIILPCYNPRTGWEKQVVQAYMAIRESLPGVETGLILVLDGPDKGVEEAQLDFLRDQIPGIAILPCWPNRGKGFALRYGVRAAARPIQVFTDVDFPYQTESFLRLYHKLAAGEADIVAGVRPDSYYEHVPAARKRISRMLRWMLRRFLKMQLTDTQCGLKGFNHRGRELFLKTSIRRFLFDLEFIYLASNTPEIRLAPEEVHLRPGIVFSKVSWRILIRESFNFIRVFFSGKRLK